ncbi:DegT/DnrJ/EryC1/StrS aminotransferase [Magnetococcus marinus MC-1]|uniref:DegT/DnrJ/EryC1/StrS aminotransferase n=1 Tax=Magnetococcus marinus (strain ATCC BAA-1437 / JCM 17883 / MC-1) TaxID=156889 RepID=A0L545_MAGMM|nr:DegT/DnrJ/EryC1/StrS family aminotransferase [Magnetococcus marinus]ABK43088.1 DegT/DnrJ/EryC1/StrS aminotransferase [Magnetococcus marinus MC-1]
MIPLAIPHLGGREADYLQQCIESTFVSSVGPFVDRFEQQVAQAAGVAHGVAVATGTAGLHAALAALHVQRDDLVILPALTFIASANAIAYLGATPWIMDVDPLSWTLDPHVVEQALAQHSHWQGDRLIHTPSGRRIAAMMPVHVLGTPADMQRLIPIAQRYKLPVVADGAAALGAMAHGQAIGALGAELTVFSFNGNKTVTCGGGGAVVSHDAALIQRVRHLTTTARQGPGYDHDEVGFNYRMTNLQAAVGCAQMERLTELVGAKRRIRDRYADALGDLPGVTPFQAPSWAKSAWWFSGVVVDRPPQRQEHLRAQLRQLGVDARPFWKPIHQQAPYRNAPVSATPVVDGLWWQILTLPCSCGLTEQDQQRVIDGVRQVLKG